MLRFVHRSSAGGCFGSSAALLWQPEQSEQPEQYLVTPVVFAAKTKDSKLPLYLYVTMAAA